MCAKNGFFSPVLFGFSDSGEKNNYFISFVLAVGGIQRIRIAVCCVFLWLDTCSVSCVNGACDWEVCGEKFKLLILLPFGQLLNVLIPSDCFLRTKFYENPLFANPLLGAGTFGALRSNH